MTLVDNASRTGNPVNATETTADKMRLAVTGELADSETEERDDDTSIDVACADSRGVPHRTDLRTTRSQLAGGT